MRDVIANKMKGDQFAFDIKTSKDYSKLPPINKHFVKPLYLLRSSIQEWTGVVWYLTISASRC